MSESMDRVAQRSAVVNWSQKQSCRWPELRTLYCFQQENPFGKRLTVPDFAILLPRDIYRGLYIELETKYGMESPERLLQTELFNRRGFFTEICHGWQSAVRVLEWYLTLPKAKRLHV
ncbi:MAG: hypothetical protein E7476_11310 [Ruminococcaceae bacterium]|nr:hypothetical protein [Oscillospiraceae bacterium]